MFLRAYQKVDMGGDLPRTVDLMQDNVGKIFNQLRLNPAAVAIPVLGINFEANKDIYVNHGLGVPFLGYWGTRIYNAVGLPLYWESDTQNKSPEKYIIFKAAGTFTMDLLVY